MYNSNILNIIKEEVSDFDFLSNDEYVEEQNETDTLDNEDFQKQFIVDSLLNKNKIKFELKNSDVESINDLNLIFEYSIQIYYDFDTTKEPIKFELNFNYDKILTNDSYDNFNWNDITVDLSTINGKDIKFKSFEKAPLNIQSMFIREYTNEYVNDIINSKTHEIQKTSHV